MTGGQPATPLPPAFEHWMGVLPPEVRESAAVRSAERAEQARWQQMTAAEQAVARLWYYCNAVDWNGGDVVQYLTEEWFPSAGLDPEAGQPTLAGRDEAKETAKLVTAAPAGPVVAW